MIITNIEPQKRNKNRISLYLDGNFYCGLSLETTVKCRLKTGDKITQEELEGVILESEKRVCFDAALKYVSRKFSTEKEARAYLERKEFLPPAIDYAVEKLIEYKYLNDAEYAKSYVNYSLNKGVLKIRYELKNKGVSENLINEVTVSIVDNQFNLCIDIAKKYMSKKEFDYKTKAALFRHLISKGFEQDVVKQTVNAVFSDNNYDE